MEFKSNMTLDQLKQKLDLAGITAALIRPKKEHSDEYAHFEHWGFQLENKKWNYLIDPFDVYLMLKEYLEIDEENYAQCLLLWKTELIEEDLQEYLMNGDEHILVDEFI